MATRIKEYGAKVNGETYPCRLNDTVYSQGGVAAALGFTKPGTGVNFNGVGDMRSLRRAGAIIRVTVRGTKTTGNSTDTKAWQLWCVASNLSSAKGALVNQSIDGYNINTVGNRQTTRFR
jgi:hypothetical protein